MIPKRETQDEEIKMQILIAPTAGFEIPKPGTYRARIIEITEHPSLNEDWGPQLLIKVELDQLDSNNEPIVVHYYCSQKFSPQSKFGKAVNTVIGRIPSVPLSRLGLLMRWLTGRGTACLGEGGLGFRSR